MLCHLSPPLYLFIRFSRKYFSRNRILPLIREIYSPRNISALRYMTAVGLDDGGGALWRWHAVMLLCHSCCLAIFMVLCRSCCQHFPWYILTVMLYSLLSGHFAAVVLRCCRHAAVHVAYHCTCCLPLSYHFAAVVQPCQHY